MKKYHVKLTALTPIVLTQRESQQMIKGLDFEIENESVKWIGDYQGRSSVTGKVADSSKITTIYAAYFNGSNYYIPGTTIKGNILKRASKSLRERLHFNSTAWIVKDAIISKPVKVENIKKVTRLADNYKKFNDESKNLNEYYKEIYFYEQFKHIGYEVIQQGTEFETIIQFREAEIANMIIECIENDDKLKQWDSIYEQYLVEGYFMSEKADDEKRHFNKIISDTKEAIGNLADDEYLISLGGMRGYYDAFESDDELPGVYFQELDGKELILGFVKMTIKEVTK